MLLNIWSSHPRINSFPISFNPTQQIFPQLSPVLERIILACDIATVFLFLSLIDISLCLDQRLSSHANPKVHPPTLTYTHTASGSTCRQNHAILRGVSPKRMDTAKLAVANMQNIFTDNVYVMWGDLSRGDILLYTVLKRTAFLN